MTSKDWPEVHLFSSMTSMSEMTHQFRSTVSAIEGRIGAAYLPRSNWGPNEHAHRHREAGVPRHRVRFGDPWARIPGAAGRPAAAVPHGDRHQFVSPTAHPQCLLALSLCRPVDLSPGSRLPCSLLSLQSALPFRWL